MIMSTLTGKTALVTGALRGISHASALAAAGVQVLVHYGRAARVKRTVVSPRSAKPAAGLTR
jgi:NAD(P)-dependent dehydrogenase (short-subunit alcohol dehydrogenase family)